MNILITGIHGFVGSNLVAALEKQHTIYGLDIVSPQKDGVLKTYSWDKLKDIPSVDVIIHLAGKAHDTKNQTNAQVYFDINTGLTQKIFDWFLTSNASKFIFFSSVKAAADQVEGDILTEDVVPSPKGSYGESKLAAERYILSHLSSSVSSLRYASLLRERLYGLRSLYFMDFLPLRKTRKCTPHRLYHRLWILFLGFESCLAIQMTIEN